MKLAGALLALATVGCHGATSLVAADLGSDGAPSTGPSTFPTGTVDAAPTRQAYPIILAHGMSGFKNIGPLNYYYGVAEALRKDGHIVYVTQVDAFNSSEVRGAELKTQVEAILADSHAEKVNLICHSQGGFDCRYVANQLGSSKIAAVVTLATPHRGTPIADIATQALQGPTQQAVDALLNLFGAALDGGKKDNAQLAINLCSSVGAADFTAKYPDAPHVAYFSIAGRSNMSVGDDTCGTPNEAPFVARWDQYVDQPQPLMAPTGTILTNNVKPPPTNDGLVPVGSAKWGTFLGCIPADHMEEVGQLAGAPPTGGNQFDHILFFRQLADWLVAHGY